MALPVLIMGKSGSGKTASLRNMTQTTLVINVNKKSLPFSKNDHIKVRNTDDYLMIREILSKTYDAGIKTVVIDDAGYLMTNKFMRGHREKKGASQYDLYNEIADSFYSLIRFITDNLQPDMIVYIVMHEDKNDMGESKPKTIGRLLDEKVCIEGLFTIVLHSMKHNGKYVFATNTDGTDVTKTPIGMFDEEYVDNDLQMIDNKIREYYKGE